MCIISFFRGSVFIINEKVASEGVRSSDTRIVGKKKKESLVIHLTFESSV